MSKVALITGVTSGIGLATVKKFLSGDYKVIAVGVNENDFPQIKKEINNSNLQVMKCDVSNRDEVKDLVTTIAKNEKKIDVLVNSAGVLAKHVDLVDADLDNIERTININLMGTIYVDKYVGQVMKEQGEGLIINIGSIDGIMANHELIAYHASKGGVHMVTKALTCELSPFGVRVVAVAPAWVETGMVPPRAKEYGLMKHRLISPEELAGAIYLMTLPEASSINGSIVMADDGYASFKGMGILDL